MKKYNWKKIGIAFLGLLLLHMLFIVFPSIFYPGSIGGNFGVRPKTHACIGITISNETALSIFPKGDITFNILGKSYEYRVNENRMLKEVCIGQDVWYGE